jgi:hypothetical protein
MRVDAVTFTNFAASELVLKSVKSVAITFPLVIAACIPIRQYLLPRLFTARDLLLLDGDDAEIEEIVQAEGISSATELNGDLDGGATSDEKPKVIFL